jgi:hypothetical protein
MLHDDQSEVTIVAPVTTTASSYSAEEALEHERLADSVEWQHSLGF